MVRPRTRLVASALALVVLVAGFVLPSPALPVTAQGGGEVEGLVFLDYNANGVMDSTTEQGTATDTPVEGILVRAFDASGGEVGSDTTAADGSYSITTGLSTGTPVRIEFSIPDTPALAGLRPSSVAAPDADGVTAAASVQFAVVDDDDVNFAVFRPGEYCQDNPRMVSCLMLQGDAAGLTAPGPFTLRPSDLASENMVWNANSALPWNSTTRKGTADAIGSVFGIGVDRSGTATTAPNAFLGTYVKRHVEYGFAGPSNAIYRLTLPEVGVGDLSVFVTLPGELPAHDPTPAPGFGSVRYTGDTDIFKHVGRIGLGDVDVTPDGRTLLAVDMDETDPKLWFVPIIGYGDDVTAGTPVSQPIPKPATFNNVACPGIWHPMGIGVRGERILVGGVCGAENTVSATTPRGPSPTQSTAFVLEWDGEDEEFSTIFAMSLDYPRGCALEEKGCGHGSSKAGDGLTAMWGAWNEYPNWIEYSTTLMKASNPQAMLANIEIADNGDLILNFRDRFGDQAKANTAAWSEAYDDDAFTDPPRPYGAMADAFSTGDILRVCSANGTLTLEANGTCPGVQGSGFTDYSGRTEFYFDNFPVLSGGNDRFHPETTNGSSATMPGYEGVWVTGWDMSFVNQQAIISFGDCAVRTGDGPCFPAGSSGNDREGFGSRIGGVSLATSGSGLTWGAGASFDKGNGLADLEVLCDQAPLQIGDRVWLDLDRDGIQGADEPGIAGVTVRLYDSSGELVGTAITDADGHYYFSSLVVEPADGGASPDSFGGGLVIGEAYTIAFDDPGDYAQGGPLHGAYLTVAGTSPATSEIDSDATLVGSGVYGDGIFPSVSVAPLEPGEHVHSYDVGFVQLVAVGDRVWVDDDRNGIQNGTEGPLSDVVITLYLADGVTPATRADGSPATTVSLADGSWVIDMLVPGDYVARFALPPGFTFTTALAGGDGTLDSDADPTTGLTAVFTIEDGVAGDTVEAPDGSFARFINPTIDAGVVPNIPVVVGVGDRVWIDIDRDGVQGSTELPLAGVAITLYEADGTTPVLRIDEKPATTVSDADGLWFIDKLAPGDYIAEFTLPEGYEFTQASVGSDPTIDSNPDPETGRTPVFTISDTATGDTTADTSPMTVATFANLTIDVGVVPIPPVLVGVGDRVWIDADSDGVQGTGELPVAGVVVTLYQPDGVTPVIRFDGTPAVAVTDADGLYFIDGLIPGDYRAEFSQLPNAYGFTEQSAGTDTEVDSDPARTTGMTAVFTIAASATGDTTADTDPNTLAAFANLTIDAGIVPLVAVGDLVWYDYVLAEAFRNTSNVWVYPAHGDGQYDAETEKGAPGVRVVLYEADGVTPATKADGSPAEAVTDASGHYVVDGLLPGTYRAKFFPPDGYALTRSLSSVPSDLNSDPDQVTFLTPSFTLTAAQAGAMESITDPTIDALFIDRTIDAGLIPAMAFSGFLWLDVNRDGISDPDEPRFPGVTVFLERYVWATDDYTPVLDADGEQVSVTTGSDGAYLFDNLPIGGDDGLRYYRLTATAPAGYEWTTLLWFNGPCDAWWNCDIDSNFFSSGISHFRVIEYYDGYDVLATLNTGTVATAMFYDPTLDGGLRTVSDFAVGVGNVVWIDEDGDGIQGPNEPGLEGVLVELFLPDGVTPVLDADGDPVSSITDEDGEWFIDGLQPGDYRALFTLPDGYALTVSRAGSDGTLDSDPNRFTGITDTFTILGSAQGDTTLDTDSSTSAYYANLTIDAGVVPYVSVGDYVWFDVNGDGLQDAADVPIAGVTLTITNVDGSAVVDVHGRPVTTTVTDEDGFYTFDLLPFGQYVVTVTTPTGYLPTLAGAGSDTELDSSTGSATSVVLDTAGQSDGSLDFGFTALVAVGDVVWIDLDGDGVQDADEPFLPGVLVRLYEADGVTLATRADGSPAVATTDTNGRWVIDGLLPGDYRATFILPCDCEFTTLQAGSDPGLDSDADVLTGTTGVFTLVPAATGAMVVVTDPTIDAVFIDPTIDAGILPLPSVSVGGSVWFDVNGDGLQDAADVPIAGVTLTITNVDGSAVVDVYGNPVTTTLTDADGLYVFDFLPFGQYVVTVTTPDGYEPTIAGVGDDPARDSSTGSATSVMLTVDGQRDLTLGFGFILAASDGGVGATDDGSTTTDGGSNTTDGGSGASDPEGDGSSTGGPIPTKVPAGDGPQAPLALGVLVLLAAAAVLRLRERSLTAAQTQDIV
jgi:protocatechuate 3,4-dioxygenase beta subunit